MNTPKKYLGLSSAERSEIQILNNKGYSLRKIAEVLGRSPNTISREIKVKIPQTPSGYSGICQCSSDLRLAAMTTDNGIENRQHAAITKATGAPVFFTDPYSNYQKGGVENANKMLRRYFPKGTNFATVTQDEVDRALWTINNKPRQSLGYKSAVQCAVERGLLLEGVS